MLCSISWSEGCRPVKFDLSDEWGLTFALLDDTRLWRQRAVHELVLRDSDHVETSVAYQVKLPLALVRRYRPGATAGDDVRLRLPLTVRPKQLLLDVDFVGANGNPVTLLLRHEIAELQMQYLSHVDSSPVSSQPAEGGLWYGVSAMTSADWRRVLNRLESSALAAGIPASKDMARTKALAEYLAADLDFEIDESDVIEWTARSDEARRALVDELGEGDDPNSSSECILLAIPFMPVKPESTTDIDQLVDEYCNAVLMRPSSLPVLAEYGRRWEVIIDTTVPVGVPCSIKMHEQRPWEGAPSPDLTQEFAFGDAATTHVEIRAADHSVELDKPKVLDVAGGQSILDKCDEIRTTADAVAIYASRDQRPYVAKVGVSARIRRAQRWVISCLLLLIVLAGAAAALLSDEQQLVESLALLTFPLTLAGVVVLSREATPLAERLLRRRRAVLTVAIVGLWGLTLLRLLMFTGFWWPPSA